MNYTLINKHLAHMNNMFSNSPRKTESRVLVNNHWVKVPINNLLSQVHLNVIKDMNIIQHLSNLRKLVEKEQDRRIISRE